MPKGGKRKRTKEKPCAADGGACLLTVPGAGLDEDEESVCSSLDGSVLSDEVVSENGDESPDSELELQFLLHDRIEQLTDKNSHTRLSALAYLNKAFRQHILLHLLSDRQETLTDVLVRGIRKVHGRECCELLQLASLMAVQLGEEHDVLFRILKPILVQIIKDHTLSPEERSAATTTLALCCFLLCHDMKEVELVMRECEWFYRSSKISVVLVAAVRSWALLLSIAPDHAVLPIMASQLSCLTSILGSSGDVLVRVAVGQAIALLFELIRDVDDDHLETDEVHQVVDLVQQIASESNRYAGRKERSQQRSSFRDISQAVLYGYVPERQVKVGVEVLELSSWAKLVQYNAFTELLGSGIRVHLQANELLREVFQLGPPPLIQHRSKADKHERKLYNAAVAKSRTQSRGKQRDKRAVL